MATSQDIRQWAQDNGYDLSDRGRVPNNVKTDYYTANPDQRAENILTQQGGASEPETGTGDGSGATDGSDDLLGGEATPEQPPGTRKRIRWGRATRTTTAGPKRRVSRGGPRASTEKVFSGIWSLAGKLLGKQGFVPTARVLQFQAPIAGVLLDKEIRGTKADSLLQPVARMVNRGSSIGTLIALPLLVQVASSRPELYPELRPYMVDCLYRWYEIAGPEMEKQAKRMEQRREAIGVDAEQVLDMIFAPVPEQTPAEV